MNSLILRSATRFMLPLLLLFSVFLLLRGHNEPGGGFSGGLVAASAFALYSFAYSVADARRALGASTQSLMAVGLLLALTSGVVSFAFQKPFLTGLWGKFPFPALGVVELGTPLIFDVGVFLVVVGVGLSIIFSLAEEE
jgi:multicomponent Na+:H+ antiporter subunit B